MEIPYRLVVLAERVSTMESEQKEGGVLFADISDSSFLFKVFGDKGARDTLLACIHVMRKVVEASPGRVVERIGDELLVFFPTADSAARGAVDLQVAVAEARGQSLPGFLSLRIGFHFGTVVVQGDALFGETVYTANRVSALAKGNQILTTGDTVARLSSVLRPWVLLVGSRTLRGTQQVHGIYRVDWDDPGLTDNPPEDALVEDVSEDVPEYVALELTHADRQMTLSPANPVCLIGRSERCDFMVHASDVSRVHTRIEYRCGRFVVVDQSKNGTVVRKHDGTRRVLHEKELRLDGSGVIQPSCEPVEIRYVCIEPPDDDDAAGAGPSRPAGARQAGLRALRPSRTPRTG